MGRNLREQLGEQGAHAGDGSGATGGYWKRVAAAAGIDSSQPGWMNRLRKENPNMDPNFLSNVANGHLKPVAGGGYLDYGRGYTDAYGNPVNDGRDVFDATYGGFGGANVLEGQTLGGGATAAPVQTRAKDAKYAMTPAMINPLGYTKPIMSPMGRPSPGPIPPGGGILSGAAAGPTTRPAQVGPILGASDVIKQNAAPVGQEAPVAPQGRSYLPQTPQTPSQFSQPGGGRQQSKRNSFTMGGLFA